jgi:putative hydrolase of the HAD superfamily
MTTVLVVPKPGQMDHRDAFEIFRDAAPPYIHFVTSDLARFLTGLAPDAPDTADV